MNNPIFSQYQKNVQRQSREQQAVGSFLWGMAIALIASIVLVAILAAYGGWILSHQIQKQSVTVAQLESKLTEDLQKLRVSLKETVNVVENLGAQSQAQKQQIISLQSQLDEVRMQNKKDRMALPVILQKIDRRLYDLERSDLQKR